jgi:hypothetical protein
MKSFSLVLVVATVLLAGASQKAAFAADLSGYETAPGRIVTTHRHVTRRVAVRGCIEVSQPPRGCPLRHYSLLPWPSVPRLDEPPYYPGYGWHRCWWGEWC